MVFLLSLLDHSKFLTLFFAICREVSSILRGFFIDIYQHYIDECIALGSVY